MRLVRLSRNEVGRPVVFIVSTVDAFSEATAAPFGLVWFGFKYCRGHRPEVEVSSLQSLSQSTDNRGFFLDLTRRCRGDGGQHHVAFSTVHDCLHKSEKASYCADLPSEFDIAHNELTRSGQHSRPRCGGYGGRING